MPQKAQPTLKSCHPSSENQNTSLHFSSSFPFCSLPSSTPWPRNLSPLRSLFFSPPTASSLLHSVSSLVVISFTFSSPFPLHFLGAEMHWIIQNGGLIYKSACSAQTSQSRSSVWRLIMAKERHGSLICNDTLQFLNWCTTSAQCVLNALQ